jgi:hybrid cluster-associated redox disulfide protein
MLRDISIEDLTVAEIMSAYPAAIRLFMDWQLHCIGCPIAPFHTICDAALEHRVSPAELVAAVEAVLENVTGDRA